MSYQFTPKKSQSRRNFCSSGVSNKISLFQGSKCTLQKKCLIESLKKIHLSIKGALFLLPPLLLCASLSGATAAEHLLFGVESALAQPSNTGHCIQREYNELLLKQLSSFMTTTSELRACLSSFPWMCHYKVRSSDANITYWPSLPL